MESKSGNGAEQTGKCGVSNAMIINLSVKNQFLAKESNVHSVELSQNYIRCIFDFLTTDWDGTDKTAVFKNSKTGKTYEVMLDNDACMIPPEVLSNNGYVQISVYGSRDSYRITSSIVSFENDKTLFGGLASEGPTLTVYEQLLNRLHEKADNIQYVDGFLQLMAGKCPVGERIRLSDSGTGGGKEIELKNDGQAICWRYTDSNEWTALIELKDLKGPPGESPEFEIRGNHLFAIYKD